VSRKSSSSKFVTYVLGSVTAPAPEPDPDDEFEDGLFDMPPATVPDDHYELEDAIR
jgi:hypothetical protein